MKQNYPLLHFLEKIQIIQLEEQKEQLDRENLDIDLLIEEAKRKVANASVMKNTLTTFAELYLETTPEEKKQLMQMHINELLWTPTKIKLALFENPTEIPPIALPTT